MKDIDLIITRHRSLATYLRGLGIKAPIVTHAEPADVHGKHICGVVPLSLASHAKSVTVVPLHIPQSKRGCELTYADLCAVADAPQRYVVKRIS